MQDEAVPTPIAAMTRNEQIQYVQTVLDPLAKAFMGNPYYLAIAGKYPSVKLEHASVSGGKYWESRATENHLVVAWGKSHGSQGASKTFLRDQCVSSNPVMELMVRAMKKLREGYRLVSCRTI